MILLVLALLLVLFLPSPWTWLLVAVAVAWEAFHAGLVLWWLRRPARAGPETMIGAAARVVSPCTPEGTVRLAGELWRARCEAGAPRGATVVVRARDRLLLHVERTS